MDLWISKILSDIREQDLDFLWLPMEHLRQEPKRHSLQSLFQRYQVPCAYGFLRQSINLPVGTEKGLGAYQMLVLWPGPNRHSEPLIVHVLKTGLLHVPFELSAWVGVLAEIFACITT